MPFMMPFKLPSVWGDMSQFLEKVESGDPDVPRLSDLVKLWLCESVKDPSLVVVEPSSMMVVGHDDPNVMELKLNGILIAWILNNKVLVRLRMLTTTGVTESNVGRECDVPAADPELFEKIWAHIAYLDAAIDCRGWSILEKHPSGKTVKEIKKENGGSAFYFPKTTEDVYPAFNDGAN